MDKTSVELDHFVHALISPLTALQGAIGLLRRRFVLSDDVRVDALLGSLERSSERLRRIGDLLMYHAESHGEFIRIVVPATAFVTETAPPPAALERAPTAAGAPARVPADAQGAQADAELLLIVAPPDRLPTALATALASRGHRLMWATSTADGIDMARQIRPGLILLDPDTDIYSGLAPELLGEDPDTKMLPLLLLEGSASTSLDRNAPIDEQIGRIEARLADGRDQGRARPHLLIVDDEPEIAELIGAQFRGEGYLTSAVGSGTEALRIVREQQFDLVLLDLLLPDIDGFTVLGGLRAQRETQLTPIILLSAINSPADKVRGLQLGADDYITKPFSNAELSARVEAATRRSEREGGANPSTRLPGNVAIERAISRRIEQRDAPCVVCYCDIDNFKAYNDSYGFLKGDAVIQRCAQILLDAVREQGNPDDFVGHIGGDDFVVITTPDLAGTVCAAAIERFDTTAPLFYDRATRERGYISGVDRQGRPNDFPLVSISIVAISGAVRSFSHPGEVAQRSVDVKKRAKLVPGSIYLLEE